MRKLGQNPSKEAYYSKQNKIGDDNTLRMPIKNFAVTRYDSRSVFLKMRNSDNEKLKMLLTIKLKESRFPIYKICETLKIDQSNFYSYLNGKIKNPGIHILFKISKFKLFNLKFTELLNLGGYEVLQIKAYKEFVSFLKKITPAKPFSTICWYVKGADLLNKIMQGKIPSFYNFRDIKENIKTYLLKNYQLSLPIINAIISGAYRYLLFLFTNGKIKFLPNLTNNFLDQHSVFKISNERNRKKLREYRSFLLTKGYDEKAIGPRLVLAFLFLCIKPQNPSPSTLNELEEMVRKSFGTGKFNKASLLYDFFEFLYNDKKGIIAEIKEKRIFERMFSKLSRKSQAVVRIFLKGFKKPEKLRVARILRLFFETSNLSEIEDISDDSISNFRSKLKELDYYEDAIEENLTIIRKLVEIREHLKQRWIIK